MGDKFTITAPSGDTVIERTKEGLMKITITNGKTSIVHILTKQETIDFLFWITKNQAVG